MSDGGGDNSGVMFGARTRLSEKGVAVALGQYFEQPAVLKCGDCNGDEFWIYVDMGGRTGCALFQCKNPNCRKGCPPVELHKPQANDVTMKKLGIYLPEPWLSSSPVGSSPDRAEITQLFADMGSEDDEE